MIQVDRPTIIQIIGSLMKKPDFLSDTDKFQLDITDFSQTLDKYIFSSIYNLYVDGAEKIHAVDIENYLNSNAAAKQLLEKENGIQFLQDCETYSEEKNFSYYYKRFKKINLLRDLQKDGRNIDRFYSTDPLNENHQRIMDNFEKMSIDDIINSLKNELAEHENKYVFNKAVFEMSSAAGIRDLLKDLKEKPEVGIRLQGDIYNTIIRGGRKGKLYLRSASTGLGKTRTMVGDACSVAYPARYDESAGEWVSLGNCEKILYIMTEQDPNEIQTMMLAYLTGYNEDMFLYGTFGDAEADRIEKAIQIIEQYQDNFLFVRVPDPCADVVKNLFRRYNFQYGVDNFFYDYIFSSPAMLDEYRDLGVREDVCLRLFTTCLKNLAVELNAFVLTSTQISNDDDPKGGFKDFRNIRGWFWASIYLYY